MTEQALLNAIRILAARHIAANASTAEAAHASLVRKGIYTENGRLTPEYGGDQQQAAPDRR